MSSMDFTTWTNLTLWWSRDEGVPFLVSLNKSNYYVRMLNGLSSCNYTVLNVHHLNVAKSILTQMNHVMVLEDPSTFEILRKYGIKEDDDDGGGMNALLPNARVSRMKENRDMKRVNVERCQWESINSLDCELYAWWNVERRKKKEKHQEKKNQQEKKKKKKNEKDTNISNVVTAISSNATYFWDDASFTRRWNYRYRPAFIFTALRELGYQPARNEQERKNALRVDQVFGVARIFHKTKQLKILKPVTGILHLSRSTFDITDLNDQDFVKYGWFVKGSPSCGGKGKEERFFNYFRFFQQLSLKVTRK